MSDLRRPLLGLAAREDNRVCADCTTPHPQWASVSFAVFLCLQCAGVHRGFGVHISFVRSVSMDTWQSDQLHRVQLGGNAPFKDFIRAYPPHHAGCTVDSDPHVLYHSWAATQYRDKLDHAVAGKPWTPSSPPPTQLTPASLPSRPSSAQALRKSRASARSPPINHAPTSSPLRSSPNPSHSSRLDQKSANEAYFASLGLANAARPSDLPPSQGGRYQGFGNTPSPPPPSQHPSLPLTSAAAPSFANFQDNPAAALSKGWSLFSAAVAGASRAVNDHVIQPGMERAMDPNLHASVRGYVSEAQKHAQLASQSVNEWSKDHLGVDVVDHVNGIVGAVKDSIGTGPAPSGYRSLHTEGEPSPSSDDTHHFFHEYSDTPPTPDTIEPSSGSHTTPVSEAKKDDDWDEWQDF